MVIGDAQHPIHDVIDVGEVPQHIAVVINL
jgi:hypothetical protein